MASTEDIMAGILNLTEDEFFSAEQTEMTQREFQLVDLDFWGVVVNAPGEIKTNEHEKLPLFIATRYSGERGWDVPLKDNCILVGTNLRDGTVHFRKAFVSERELVGRWHEITPPRGSKPTGLPIRSAGIRSVDVRQRLDVKWNTGIWAMGVINNDWPSNTVIVEQQGDEVVKPLTAQPVNPDPDPRGAAFLPCYLPTGQTPKSPESGLTFTGEFKVEDEKQQLNIFGSFAVQVRDFHLPAKQLVHTFEKGKQQNVAAVVPVTLAVLGMDWDEPLQIDWAVPVYGKPLAVGMMARGCFAINALAEAQALGPGKYVCYLILDGRIFGPKTLQVTEPVNRGI